MKASGTSGQTRQIGSLMGIGIQLVATIVGFGALGWWLDTRFDTKPWLLLAGVIFGATGGMIGFIRTALMAGGGGGTKGRAKETDRNEGTAGRSEQ